MSGFCTHSAVLAHMTRHVHILVYSFLASAFWPSYLGLFGRIPLSECARKKEKHGEQALSGIGLALFVWVRASSSGLLCKLGTATRWTCSIVRSNACLDRPSVHRKMSTHCSALQTTIYLFECVQIEDHSHEGV